MKSIVSTYPGSAQSLTLEDVTEPSPGKGEALLRVHNCAINFPDSLIIEDKYQIRPERPFSPGGEVSGEVIALGEAVSDLKIGDRVIGISTHGGMAEKMTLPAVNCSIMPDEMPWDVGSALIFTYGTAYHALHNRANISEGDNILVLGAAGGVGLATIQLAKAAGARVVAAVSSGEKAQLAKDAGADDTVIYPTGALDKDSSRALVDAFKAACGKNGFDIVSDNVGGDYTEPALRSIGWEGKFLVIGFPAGIPKISANLILLKACQIIGIFWGTFTQMEKEKNQANNAAIMELWKAGKIAPHISAHYPLAEAGQAIADLAERRALGKIVVDIA